VVPMAPQEKRRPLALITSRLDGPDQHANNTTVENVSHTRLVCQAAVTSCCLVWGHRVVLHQLTTRRKPLHLRCPGDRGADDTARAPLMPTVDSRATLAAGRRGDGKPTRVAPDATTTGICSPLHLAYATLAMATGERSAAW
jgi:hypothetical protein